MVSAYQKKSASENTNSSHILPFRLWGSIDTAVLLLILAGAAWSLFSLHDGGGKRIAKIYIGNRQAGFFPLENGPDTIHINTKIGPALLQYGAFGIRVISSHCLHKFCIRQGVANRSYHKLICAPARLMVTIQPSRESEADNNLPDAVSR